MHGGHWPIVGKTGQKTYLERIQMLLFHTGSLQSKHQVDLFTCGLIELRVEFFELQAPQDLVIAKILARACWSERKKVLEKRIIGAI